MRLDVLRLSTRSRNCSRVGLGAGLLGAMLVALKYALRPPTKSPVPDTISPGDFSPRKCCTPASARWFTTSRASGQPLVFVHGVSLGRVFLRVVESLSGVRRSATACSRSDLVGFGESARPRCEHRRGGFGADAGGIPARDWEHPAILDRQRLGGGICALIASQHPELVARLILHMPTAATDSDGSRMSTTLPRAALSPLLARFLYRNYLSTRILRRTWLTQFGFLDPARVTEEMIEVYATCAQQPAAEHAALAWLSGALSFDLEARWRTLPQPVALLWGEEPAPERPRAGPFACNGCCPRVR